LFLRPRCLRLRSGGSGRSFGSTPDSKASSNFSISSSQAPICS
jgi:hypothetical protein